MPDADNIDAALLAFTDASVGTALVLLLDLDVAVVDDPVELFVPLDAELAAVLVDVAALEAVGAVGMKLSLPTPKPRAAASLPLPWAVTSSV